MTTDDTTTKTEKSPSHAAFHVREFGKNGNRKSVWTRVGAAWPHADGQGFNVQIECVPLDGRLSLRVITERDA